MKKEVSLMKGKQFKKLSRMRVKVGAARDEHREKRKKMTRDDLTHDFR